MRKLTNVLIPSILVALVAGCGAKDEPRTYGVRNSKWSSMNVAQKKEAQDRYEHEIRVSERRRVEAEMLVQKEQEAKLRLEERVNNLEMKHNQPAYAPAPTTVIIQQPPAQTAQAAPVYTQPAAPAPQDQTVIVNDNQTG